MFPLTVHTPIVSEEYATAKPLLAVAAGLMAKVPPLTKMCAGYAGKSIVCAQLNVNTTRLATMEMPPANAGLEPA